MRRNLAVVGDPVAASRASVTAALERVKQEQSKLDRTDTTVADCLVLADKTGVAWCITVDPKGVLTVTPFQGKPDAAPAVK